MSQPTAMRPRSRLDDAGAPAARAEHDGARDRQREAEHEPAADLPAHSIASARPRAVAPAICTMAPGMAIARTDRRSLQREMQADAEHQENHADLGEFVGEALVRHIARGEGADRDTSQEIPDKGDRRIRCARTPRTRANTRPMTIVEINGVWCGIRPPS